MRTYIKRDNDKIKEMYCNCCGKQIVVEKGIIKEGVMSLDYSWGFFSDKDGEIHSIDLCEECYNEMIRKFKIPVEKIDSNEMI